MAFDDSVSLPFDVLTHDEKISLPELKRKRRSHLLVRNALLIQWSSNTSAHVPAITGELSEKQQKYVPLIHAYLERNGHINVGNFKWPTKKVSRKDKKSVVVVGAGVAGLACASRLHQLGYTVTVVEAASEIGGRCKTIKLASNKKQKIELGAHTILGLKSSPLAIVCGQSKVESRALSNVCALLDGTGGKCVDPTVLTASENFFCVLLQKVELTEPDSNVGEALQKAVDTSDLPDKVDMNAVNWFVQHMERSHYAEVGHLSLKEWGRETKVEPEGPSCVIPDGFDTLCTKLRGTVALGNIKKNTIVTNIEYKQEDPTTTSSSSYLAAKPCTVTTTNVQFGHQNELSCDYVVVTVPLGVLKEGSIAFDPHLPDWKQDSIKRLGVGSVEKIALVYEDAWWKDSTNSNHVEGDCDFFGVLDGDGLGGNSSNLAKFLYCTDKTHNVPCLIAVLHGTMADRSREMDDSTLFEAFKESLAQAFPDVTIPNPIESFRTRWGKAPQTLGANSYLRVGCTIDDYNNIQKPIQDRLFFAGEAACTNAIGAGTIIGAYVSGVQAAFDIHSTTNPVEKVAVDPNSESEKEDDSDEPVVPLVDANELPPQVPSVERELSPDFDEGDVDEGTVREATAVVKEAPLSKKEKKEHKKALKRERKEAKKAAKKQRKEAQKQQDAITTEIPQATTHQQEAGADTSDSDSDAENKATKKKKGNADNKSAAQKKSNKEKKEKKRKAEEVKATLEAKKLKTDEDGVFDEEEDNKDGYKQDNAELFDNPQSKPAALEGGGGDPDTPSRLKKTASGSVTVAIKGTSQKDSTTSKTPPSSKKPLKKAVTTSTNPHARAIWDDAVHSNVIPNEVLMALSIALPDGKETMSKFDTPVRSVGPKAEHASPQETLSAALLTASATDKQKADPLLGVDKEASKEDRRTRPSQTTLIRTTPVANLDGTLNKVLEQRQEYAMKKLERKKEKQKQKQKVKESYIRHQRELHRIIDKSTTEQKAKQSQQKQTTANADLTGIESTNTSISISTIEGVPTTTGTMNTITSQHYHQHQHHHQHHHHQHHRQCSMHVHHHHHLHHAGHLVGPAVGALQPHTHTILPLHQQQHHQQLQQQRHEERSSEDTFLAPDGFDYAKLAELQRGRFNFSQASAYGNFGNIRRNQREQNRDCAYDSQSDHRGSDWVENVGGHNRHSNDWCQHERDWNRDCDRDNYNRDRDRENDTNRDQNSNRDNYNRDRDRENDTNRDQNSNRDDPPMISHWDSHEDGNSTTTVHRWREHHHQQPEVESSYNSNNNNKRPPGGEYNNKRDPPKHLLDSAAQHTKERSRNPIERDEKGTTNGQEQHVGGERGTQEVKEKQEKAFRNQTVKAIHQFLEPHRREHLSNDEQYKQYVRSLAEEVVATERKQAHEMGSGLELTTKVIEKLRATINKKFTGRETVVLQPIIQQDNNPLE